MLLKNYVAFAVIHTQTVPSCLKKKKKFFLHCLAQFIINFNLLKAKL